MIAFVHAKSRRQRKGRRVDMLDAYFIMPTLSEAFDKVHRSFRAAAFELITSKGSCGIEALQSPTGVGPKGLLWAEAKSYMYW